MDVLASLTLHLKESLSTALGEKDKEENVVEHIRKAEALGSTVDDFPPELDWLNTHKPLSSSLLEGKIVVLDFFTYCCINCLHIIPHLRQLEENFSVADGLVVIGVHSAKFENEKNSQNILSALKRYNITHPVVNDKNCYLWNKLNISCWPTILILGPRRQPIFCLVGEGHKDELLLFVKIALKFYKNDISSHHLPLVSCDQIVTSSLLNFPGKISRWNNCFAVSDSGNHRIIVFTKDGFIKFKIGGKSPGFKDGSLDSALFNSPQGVVFYSAYLLYVADTKNHAIRLVDLEALKVTTVVGNGRQGVDNVGNKPGKLQEISSPWDVCIVPCSDIEIPSTNISVPLLAGGPALPPLSAAGDVLPPPPPPPFSLLHSAASGTSNTPPPPPPPPLHTSITSPKVVSPDVVSPPSTNKTGENISQSKVLLIAASGTHQIWAYFIESGFWWKGKKYDKDVCLAIAGTGKEENRNNRYPMMASFAQPSGLCYSPELKSVFIADSESSSIRKLSLKDGSVSHVVGGARAPDDLFSYGDVDSRGYDAKLQHPLGVAWNSKEASVFVCDTYNHKIKKISLTNGYCESIHKSSDLFNEPSGCCFSDSNNFLYVTDTNNNCIKVVNMRDNSVNKFDIKEGDEGDTENHFKDVWEEEVFVSKTEGILTLTVNITPVEIRGTWAVKLDESKIKTTNLKGKLRSNEMDVVFFVSPSEKDDVVEMFFNFVLCGSDVCNFKKFSLKLHVRKKEESTEKNVSHKVFVDLNNLIGKTSN